MKVEHYALIAGVIILAVLLYANRGCSSCKQKYGAISGVGVWPGAGPGVQVRDNLGG